MLSHGTRGNVFSTPTLICLQNELSLMSFEIRAVSFVLVSTPLKSASRRKYGSDLAKEMQVLCAAAKAPSPLCRNQFRFKLDFIILQLEIANVWKPKQWVKVTTLFQFKCKRGFI